MLFHAFLSKPWAVFALVGKMKRKLRVAQFGLGPIGLECLRLAESKPWVRIIGGIDVDPVKIRRNLGELTGVKGLRSLPVVGSADELKQKPDVIFHTAVSQFKTAYAQLEPLVRRGINVVSSCEELVFPQLREPTLAAKLDRLCRKSGARIVGTGVNPGFVMDLLPLCLTVVSQEIRAIHIRRVVNASTRRQSLQRKIGSGLAPEEFQRRFLAGKAGHAGLQESLALIAHTLGWNTSKIQETGEAVVARKDICTKYLQVRRGETCGLHQRAEAKVDGHIRITLDLKMYLDAQDPHDAIRIEGSPPMDLMIRGGIAGDQATVAALVNTAPRLLRAEPGLRLVTELPVA
jgi:hypothetical protein